MHCIVSAGYSPFPHNMFYFTEMETRSLKSEFDCSVNIFCTESFTHSRNIVFELYNKPCSDATIISIVWNLEFLKTQKKNTHVELKIISNLYFYV